MSIKLVDLVRVDQASRFSTGVFRVRLGANTRGICTNTQSYSAETLVVHIFRSIGRFRIYLGKTYHRHDTDKTQRILILAKTKTTIICPVLTVCCTIYYCTYAPRVQYSKHYYLLVVLYVVEFFVF